MPTAPKITKVKLSPFWRYRDYVSRLQTLATKNIHVPHWDEWTHAALNGQASVELRRVAPLKTRRKFGAYFTGTQLSQRLLTKCTSFADSSFFYDPSCGIGDLLLAAAKKLPLAKNFNKTLRQWGRQLAGTDLHEEFIHGAKARLVLLAKQRHRTVEQVTIPSRDLFPHIRVGNGFRKKKEFRKATTILINPPFGAVVAPPDCDWAGGRVSEAAVFVMTALERVRPGTEILAILPEVLRSGSFSQEWRNQISKLAEVHSVDAYGIFDESADIDVFLLRLIRRHNNEPPRIKRWPTSRQMATAIVGDCFDVHVGKVVPHRDRKAGMKRVYIHPRSVPAWKVVRRFKEKRRHQGSAYTPPFVVIRRTSRPGDSYRATATVIAGKRPIAVENHLVVCEPKDGTLKSCRELMRQLKNRAVNDFLNRKIRCRHLTVGSVKLIPFQVKRKRRHE